jgi:hypothetical protein
VNACDRPPDDYATWLSPNTPEPELISLLRPFADEPMQEHYFTAE